MTTAPHDKNGSKIAVVTGSSAGIGHAIAQALSNAGYRVFDNPFRRTVDAAMLESTRPQ